MKKNLLLVVGLLVLCSPLVAQDFKRVEVFGGYQFAHAQPNANGNGWNVALTGNITRSIGITGDFSGNYESGSSLYTYMVGPTFALRTERVTPFAHALFGGAHADGVNAFSMALGGGLDVNAGEHVAIRVIQADWLMFRRAGEATTEMRGCRWGWCSAFSGPPPSDSTATTENKQITRP